MDFKIEYEVDFILRGEQLTTVVHGRLTDIQNGFWLDENKDYITGGECTYWIPPSQITLIHRKKIYK